MRVSFLLRTILQETFPGVDFSCYLDFLESLPILKRGPGIHRHHILPKKKFPEHKKNSDNLMYLSVENHFKAHYYLALCAPDCSSFQRAFFYMANTNARKIRKEKLPEYAKIYERGREEQVNLIRSQGYVQGFENASNGHMERIRNLPQAKEAQLESGRQAVNNGRAYGRTQEGCVKGGQVGGPTAGQIAVETGQLASVAAKGGRIGGKIAVETGQLEKALHIRWHVNRKLYDPSCLHCAAIFMPKDWKIWMKPIAAYVDTVGNHIRWHVNREIISPNCTYCQNP